jgi:hypothetical protein
MGALPIRRPFQRFLFFLRLFCIFVGWVGALGVFCVLILGDVGKGRGWGWGVYGWGGWVVEWWLIDVGRTR